MKKGLWVRRHPGVYALAVVPSSWLQDVWAAVLAVGQEVTVTHETALLLAGAASDTEVPRRPIVMTVSHGRHPRVEGAVVHQIDDIRARHVGQINGLDVSTVPRAVVDIAPTMGRRRLRRLVDGLIVGKQTTRESIAAVLHEVTRPGKPGVIKLGQLLDELGDGYVPPHSDLEALLLKALEAGGLPPPQRQMRLPGRGAIEGLADAGYEDVKLLLEADGRRWHSRHADFNRDRVRDAEAARVGWQTLRFTYEQLTSDPDDVAATVADVRRGRLAWHKSATAA